METHQGGCGCPRWWKRRPQVATWGSWWSKMGKPEVAATWERHDVVLLKFVRRGFRVERAL